MLFGDKSRFAIETASEASHAKYVFGHLCIWAGGYRIGDPEQTVLLGSAIVYFRDSMRYLGQRRVPELWALTGEQLLSFLKQQLYAPAKDAAEEINWEELSKYEQLIIGVNFSEAFDGCFAALLECENAARFIGRSFEGPQVRDVMLEIGEYERVVSEFVAWVEGLTVHSEIAPGPASPPGQASTGGEPVSDV